MEDGLKALLKGLKGVPKAARDCDACTVMETRLKQLLACMPLVTDLRSPAVRPRHWEALFAGELTVLTVAVCLFVHTHIHTFAASQHAVLSCQWVC